MCKVSTAIFSTAISLLMKLTIGLAATRNNTETNAIKTALYFAAVHTDCSARFGYSAPRFCPTSVAAALLMPHAGSKKNNNIRIAT